MSSSSMAVCPPVTSTGARRPVLRTARVQYVRWRWTSLRTKLRTSIGVDEFRFKLQTPNSEFDYRSTPIIVISSYNRAASVFFTPYQVRV